MTDPPSIFDTIFNVGSWIGFLVYVLVVLQNHLPVWFPGRKVIQRVNFLRAALVYFAYYFLLYLVCACPEVGNATPTLLLVIVIPSMWFMFKDWNNPMIMSEDERPPAATISIARETPPSSSK